MYTPPLLKRFAFRTQRIIGRYPLLFYPIRKRLSKHPELAVQHDTALVIEGFPRSGNSFSIVAFEQAQTQPIKIAHHSHTPSQIIAGARMGIPIIVLLREPVSAICSLVVRENYLTLNLALWDYINFHKRILPFKKHFLVAPFDIITSNFGEIIFQLNQKYNTDYGIFNHTEENVAKAFTRLDTFEITSDGNNVDENRVARPSQSRKNQAAYLKSELLSPKYSNRLAIAQSLYNKLNKQD